MYELKNISRYVHGTCYLNQTHYQNKEEHNVNYKKINLQKLNIVTHG